MHESPAAPPLPTAPRRSLCELAPGEAGLVVAVAPPLEAQLAQEGIRPGVSLEVESRVPLGGPLVVRVGRARLALARVVAADVLIEPAPSDPRS